MYIDELDNICKLFDVIVLKNSIIEDFKNFDKIKNHRIPKKELLAFITYLRLSISDIDIKPTINFILNIYNLDLRQIKYPLKKLFIIKDQLNYSERENSLKQYIEFYYDRFFAKGDKIDKNKLIKQANEIKNFCENRHKLIAVFLKVIADHHKKEMSWDEFEAITSFKYSQKIKKIYKNISKKLHFEIDYSFSFL